jgi:hypothetical protein
VSHSRVSILDSSKYRQYFMLFYRLPFHVCYPVPIHGINYLSLCLRCQFRDTITGIALTRIPGEIWIPGKSWPSRLSDFFNQEGKGQLWSSRLSDDIIGSSSAFFSVLSIRSRTEFLISTAGRFLRSRAGQCQISFGGTNLSWLDDSRRISPNRSVSEL